MGSSFGQLFRITTWGESHGGAVGVVIDGCPPRLELSEEDIQRELDRRRPGQSEIVTRAVKPIAAGFYPASSRAARSALPSRSW